MTDPARRHLAAILCGDVVGYSRLMAHDADATVNRLGNSRERIGRLVEQRRGRLVDFSGDAFLAEFPSALDAVPRPLRAGPPGELGAQPAPVRASVSRAFALAHRSQERGWKVGSDADFPYS